MGRGWRGLSINLWLNRSRIRQATLDCPGRLGVGWCIGICLGGLWGEGRENCEEICLSRRLEN